MNKYVKFKTNLPELVEFSFSEPKIYDSKFKEGEKVYSYGVVWGGENAYLTATPYLNDLLQTIGALKGKQLYINKIEIENNKKSWQILDSQKTDITPQVIKTVSQGSGVQSGQQTPPSSNSDVQERLNRASIAFTALENRLNRLEVQIGVMNLEMTEFHKKYDK